MNRHRAAPRYGVRALVARVEALADRIAAWSVWSAPDPDPVLPATVGETGCGPDGEWCTGFPTGETAPSFAPNPIRRPPDHHPDELTW